MFDDINAMTPIETMTMEINYPRVGGASSSTGHRSRGGWLRKMFKWKRSVSS